MLLDGINIEGRNSSEFLPVSISSLVSPRPAGTNAGAVSPIAVELSCFMVVHVPGLGSEGRLRLARWCSARRHERVRLQDAKHQALFEPEAV
jgi:hypothetical protein